MKSGKFFAETRNEIDESHLMQPLITVENVSKQFRTYINKRSLQQLFIDWISHKEKVKKAGVFWSVKDISLSIYPGDKVGIIGHNGSGKSTLLKLITGILEPTKGTIKVNGRISSLLELGAGFHPDLTGRENVFLNGALHGLSQRQMMQRLDDIIQFAELDDFIDTPVKHYSSGMYMRLGFSVAIHADPDLLIVDEVLAVGDAAFQQKCMQAVHRFCNNGGTLVLVTHDLGSVQSICKKAIWMEKGIVRKSGDPVDVVLEYLSVASAKGNTDNIEMLPSLENGMRWGTGRVQISKVTMHGTDGAEKTLFDTHCPMEVRIHYKNVQNVEAPVIGIGIHHQNGTHITGPNTGVNNWLVPAEKEGTISYHIPSLSLLPGQYLLSVAAVHSKTNEAYDHHDRAYNFAVSGGSTREHIGVVSLNGYWSTFQNEPSSNNGGQVQEEPINLDSIYT